MELKFFRILKADPIGDEWTPKAEGAKPLQNFWCQFAGVEHPVMVSKQVPNTPSLSYGQFGYLMEATSAKGNPYFKFKGMKTPDGMEQPRYDVVENAVTDAVKGTVLGSRDFGAEIDDLNEKVQLILERLPEQTTPVKTSEVDKETLEDIFGGPIGEPVEIPDDDSK